MQKYVPKQEPQTLEEALKQGKVWILYQKVSGKIGDYIGTRNLSLIPIVERPKGGERKENQLPYYNLQEGNEGWKSISYRNGKVLDWQFIGNL
jgi:hypothetical protein